RPLAAVLIGGRSRSHRLGVDDAERLCAELEKLAAQACGLAVTTSRRTGARQTALIAERLREAGAWVWTGEADGPNPYFGLLALADAILVTEDSTNMVTEAAATGKPVHILPLPGGSDKFRRFHEEMRAHGATRPFAGRLEQWSYSPLTETARAAKIVDERLNLHAI
ncbi:MAG: ELM1/GtrOC1 family putative glycosyltransferase, partial [Alphaproteobacteria bacterium]